jgi:tRNA A37 N6-isopentenylltransferase MiaA
MLGARKEQLYDRCAKRLQEITRTDFVQENLSNNKRSNVEQEAHTSLSAIGMRQDLIAAQQGFFDSVHAVQLLVEALNLLINACIL